MTGVLPDPVLRPPEPARDVDLAALAADLRAEVDGEVRFDAGSRAAYSTDAANYRLLPLGVVVPRSVEAAVAAVAFCRRHGAPLTSRGGGTSLAGECTNTAVGGMIGNNSCGATAQRAGKVVDNVVELEVLLHDGARRWVGETSEEAYARVQRDGGRIGSTYGPIAVLADLLASVRADLDPDDVPAGRDRNGLEFRAGPTRQYRVA